jgi:arsenate reductase
MDDTRLYHNPACSKSREALQLLQERGIAPRIIPYLEQPPSVGEIRSLLALLGMPARALLRTGEEAYAALNLADASLSEDALIQALAVHPRLLQRPVFVHAGRAVIGRPTERVLELLSPA